MFIRFFFFLQIWSDQSVFRPKIRHFCFYHFSLNRFLKTVSAIRLELPHLKWNFSTKKKILAAIKSCICRIISTEFPLDYRDYRILPHITAITANYRCYRILPRLPHNVNLYCRALIFPSAKFNVR